MKTTKRVAASSGSPGSACSESVAVELEPGAVAHVSPDAPAPLIAALGKMVTAAKEHFSPHARFARRLRELGFDARTERMHILADVCDEMADELESGKSPKPKPQPSTRHKYVPHKKYPWFCGKCGYAEHEALMHFPNISVSGPCPPSIGSENKNQLSGG